MLTTRRVVSYVLRVLNVVLKLFFKEKPLVSSVTLLCYFLLVIEAAFICAVLLTSSAYLVTGKSFRLLCSFYGRSFGLFHGVISPLFKFQKLKAKQHIILFNFL